MTTPMLAGEGSYSFKISGERHRQAELHSICSSLDANVEVECLGLLVPEPASQQVRVEISGRRVGHLSRSDAAQYRKTIGGEITACRALVRGDEDPEGGPRLYEVGLDLFWPPRFASGEGWPIGRARRLGATRRRGGRMAGTVLAGLVVSVALGVGFYNLPPASRDDNMAIGQTVSSSPEAGADVESAALPTQIDAHRENGHPAEAGPTQTRNVCPTPETAAGAWLIVVNSGLVQSVLDTGDIVVNEALWDAFPQEDRERFAMAAYCRSGGVEDGMLVIGSDRQIRGSVIDGVWRNPIRE
jgi:hypothetical protein